MTEILPQHDLVEQRAIRKWLIARRDPMARYDGSGTYARGTSGEVPVARVPFDPKLHYTVDEVKDLVLKPLLEVIRNGR